MQSTTTFKSWPIPAKLEVALHGAGRLDGCQGLVGKERGPECCRIPDGILDFSKISFPLDMENGLLAITFSFVSHIPDTISGFITQYRGSVLTETDVAYLESEPVRARIFGRIAGTRIIRRLQVQARAPEQVHSAAIIEGFVRIHAFADARCETFLHDVHVAVGPCESNQFLLNHKYGGSFRMLYAHSEDQGEQIVFTHFPVADEVCSKVAEVRTQNFAFGGCKRLRNNFYIRAVKFSVRPPVTLVIMQKDGEGGKRHLGTTVYANGGSNSHYVSKGTSGNSKGSLLTKLPHVVTLSEEKGLVHLTLRYKCNLLGQPSRECSPENDIDVGNLKCGTCLPVDNSDGGVSVGNPERWCFGCHTQGDPNARHLHARVPG